MISMQLLLCAVWCLLLLKDLCVDAFAVPVARRAPSKLKSGAVGGSMFKRRKFTFEKKEPPVFAAESSVAKVSAVERLQKVIAHSGMASRRTAEEMIQDGRVSVNGKLVTDLGTKINSKIDNILVDGKKVTLPDVKATFWVAVHKPKSMLTTMRDEKDRNTVLSIVPKAHELHLVPVGGLDRDYTGLMVLTNDVGWIHHLTHPAYPHNNRYEVLVEGLPDEEKLDILREGVLLAGDKVRCTPSAVNVVDFDRKSQMSMLNILVDERRAMQLERMLEHIGCKVVSMKRLEFCGLRLKGLKKGAWRELTPTEVSSLKLNCHPAAGLKKGYAAVEDKDTNTTIHKATKDRAVVIPAAATRSVHSKGPLSVVPVKKESQGTASDTDNKDPAVRKPHRLKPRYRDEAPAMDDDEDEVSAYERFARVPTRRSVDTSAVSAVHTKQSSTHNSKGSSRWATTPAVPDTVGATTAQHVERSNKYEEYAPKAVRKNEYDRSFRPKPVRPSSASRRVMPARMVRRGVDPNRPVYAAEPWMKGRKERVLGGDRDSEGGGKKRAMGAKSNKHSKFNRKSSR